MPPFLSQNMAKVDPYGCWDGAVDGVAGDEELESMLGSILDFPDFPMENLECDGFAGEWDASKSQHLGPIPMDVLMGPPTISQSKIDDGPSVFMHRSVALIDTTPETKQLTHQFEDAASSCIRRQNKSTKVQETGTFQSQSPVSVLENSGSALTGKNFLLQSHIAKRTRSKRARPAAASPWLLLSPFFSTLSASRKTCDAKKMKERRKKLPHPSVTKQTMENSSGTARNSCQASDYAELANAAAQPRLTKKCTHCEITKTPQWREGPLGPKTLCNACGVRYRSGRLYPEYRPAASPTFVPSLHSNSHKKVIEMRNKGKHQVNKIEQPSMSPQLEFIPVSSYLFDPIC